jgi:uncharacterized protein (UPF0332 family)
MERCFEERKLRHDRPDPLKAQKSVSAAEAKLGEAEKLAQAGFASASLLSAYSAMFHAGRALLFRDGVVEKSHYCLIAYLHEKYAETGKLNAGTITVMDAFREERHDVLYSLEGIAVRQDDTKTAIDAARKLIAAVKRLLKDGE